MTAQNSITPNGRDGEVVKTKAREQEEGSESFSGAPKRPRDGRRWRRGDRILPGEREKILKKIRAPRNSVGGTVRTSGAKNSKCYSTVGLTNYKTRRAGEQNRM